MKVWAGRVLTAVVCEFWQEGIYSSPVWSHLQHRENAKMTAFSTARFQRRHALKTANSDKGKIIGVQGARDFLGLPNSGLSV